MPGFPRLGQSSPKACIIGIPFQASIAVFAIFSLAALHARTWSIPCPFGLATKVLGGSVKLRRWGRLAPGSCASAMLSSADPFPPPRPAPRVRWHAARSAGGSQAGSAGTRRAAFGFPHATRRAAWHPSSRSSRSGTSPDRAAKALAARASQRDAFIDLGIPTSVTASLESPAGTIASGDPVRAEDMMRERSQATIEHVQTFERRGRSVAVADPVAFSAAGPRPPAA